MRVLVGCEFSGTVRDAFIRGGHDAMSCDLLPTEKAGPHYQGDIFDVIGWGWDLAIFHPPCTYLSSSGLHWNQNPKSVRYGGLQTEEALLFVQRLLDAKVPRIALENPIGCIGTRIRKASQIIQPYQFGDDASKGTCLWLKGLPLLVAEPALRIPGRVVEYKGKLVERWANQTDSGQNKLGPSADRWAERSITYPGIALAMVSQWGMNEAVQQVDPRQQALFL